MSPTLALAVWAVSLLCLLRFDPARGPKTSFAVWIPVIHFFIIASRLPSQWLGGQADFSAQAMEEGNALDRNIYLCLIVVAVIVLIARSFDWAGAVMGNRALSLFLLFGLVSLVWSDFPFVAFKRWFRDVGQYLTILVAVTDPRPADAIRQMFRRLYFLLLPLCILMNKYYPELSKQYDHWTGQGYFVGATTSKNMLGLVCLTSGLFFAWDTLTLLRDRSQSTSKSAIALNLMFFGMAVWLLIVADSATSRVCLVLGCAVLLLAHTKAVVKRRRLLTVSVFVGCILYEVLAFVVGVDINALVAQAVGRDPTLTGRVFIWETLLNMDINPLLGTGYENFWLGERLAWVWKQNGTINEAHNGFLHIYLNLGLIGVSLLGFVLASAYYRICKRLSEEPLGFHTLGLAVWAVLVFYNTTEVAFPTGLLWFTVVPSALLVGWRTGADVAGPLRLNTRPPMPPRPPLPVAPHGAGVAPRATYRTAPPRKALGQT